MITTIIKGAICIVALAVALLLGFFIAGIYNLIKIFEEL